MKKMTFLILAGFILWALPAHADMAQRTAYITANPDAKPKCMDCHVDKMPKKADGAHDNNAYGLAVIAAAKAAGRTTPIAADYTTVGTIEAFAAKNASATK